MTPFEGGERNQRENSPSNPKKQEGKNKRKKKLQNSAASRKP